MKRFAWGRWVVVGYFLIGLLYAVYANNWGDEPYRSFAYHLGQGLVWPVVVLPGLGKFIGGLLLVAMGLVWMLQGLGVIGGSAMSGQTLWAVIGPIVALAGLALVLRGTRRRA